MSVAAPEPGGVPRTWSHVGLPPLKHYRLRMLLIGGGLSHPHLR